MRVKQKPSVTTAHTVPTTTLNATRIRCHGGHSRLCERAASGLLQRCLVVWVYLCSTINRDFGLQRCHKRLSRACHTNKRSGTQRFTCAERCLYQEWVCRSTFTSHHTRHGRQHLYGSATVAHDQAPGLAHRFQPCEHVFTPHSDAHSGKRLLHEAKVEGNDGASAGSAAAAAATAAATSHSSAREGKGACTRSWLVSW